MSSLPPCEERSDPNRLRRLQVQYLSLVHDGICTVTDYVMELFETSKKIGFQRDFPREAVVWFADLKNLT
jgi:hypothetical protein